MQESLFRIIAHRGASAVAPENTLAAFAAAVEMGAREVETDVQLTADGHLVLCHDEHLERYGHGPKRVQEMTLAELARLDFGSWFGAEFAGERILRLEELLDYRDSSLTYHIELKGHQPRLPAVVCALLTQRSLWDRCVITSFALPMLQSVRQLSPKARLGWLIGRIDDDALRVAAELQLFQLCPRATQVTREDIQRGLQTVAEIRAWGCPRQPPEARNVAAFLRDIGCHGVTVDNPQWLLTESTPARSRPVSPPRSDDRAPAPSATPARRARP